MKEFIACTLGALTWSYLFRQYIFSLIIAGMVFEAQFSSKVPTDGVVAMIVVNSLLYPYSRFVYEAIIDFIIGDNQFTVNALWMLAVKVTTMCFCWFGAVFIAPFGLIYLYIRNTHT